MSYNLEESGHDAASEVEWQLCYRGVPVTVHRRSDDDQLTVVNDLINIRVLFLRLRRIHTAWINSVSLFFS